LAAPLLLRIADFATETVSFTLDGEPARARAGETVLAAILTRADHVRRHETSGEKRAGFCLMGACQDCWVWLGPDRRGRACTTPVEEGMQVSTQSPSLAPGR
jgi:predicted molibdopterin-dependent oxidoreductase YjgC